MLSCIPWFFIEIGCKTSDPRDDGCENDRDSAYKTEAAWWDQSLRQVAKMFLVSLPPIRLLRASAALVGACEWRNVRSESARSSPKIRSRQESCCLDNLSRPNYIHPFG
jgi:hypothetical protein